VVHQALPLQGVEIIQSNSCVKVCFDTGQDIVLVFGTGQDIVQVFGAGQDIILGVNFDASLIQNPEPTRTQA